MRLLFLHPGANWATADVALGLSYGLKHYGVQLIHYRLDQRITFAGKTLHIMWRHKKKADPSLTKPTKADVMYQAGVGALEMALREKVDAVLAVSGMLLHPDVVIMMKRAGLRVVVLFTESPYDMDKELAFARLVDGCWTNERCAVKTFRLVNSNAGYVPHAWHPERHGLTNDQDDAGVPSHDVVFVGTGVFHERVAWFNSIDWSGIDLGLYGNWKGSGLSKRMRTYLRGDCVTNDYTAALYRKAKIGLNLYRSSMGWGKGAPSIAHAESLNPRAYELAACGLFHISSVRAEVREVFGDLVPTFTTPTEAAALIRLWLTDEAGRKRIAEQLPACVAEMSWLSRAKTVIGDLQTLMGQSIGDTQPQQPIQAADSQESERMLIHGAAGG